MKERFGLYVILTDPVAGYETCARAVVDCGVRYLQLRMKDSPHETMIETAHAIRAITRGTRTRFIVNDDLSVAIESDADGLHLGQDDQPLDEARAQWNQPGKIFGLSTHNAQQASLALESTPDYIGIGPVFPTRTKINAAPVLGPVETGRIVQTSPITSVAIGGIDADNLPILLDTGTQNFCVAGAVNASPDPTAVIRNLNKIWERYGFCP